MKGRPILMSVLTLGLLLALMIGLASGQGPEPAGEVGVQAPVNTAFTYQGRLTDAAGNPLTGNYNLVFQLWDDATAGSQVGSDMVKNNVPVSNGLFTVELDVPQDAFNGQALWLRVQVNGQWLTPRQELLPVPYALSLRPGAQVEGDSSDKAVSVTNTGSGDVRNYGGYFVAAGTQGRGIYGKASNTADAINYGGFFYASGVQGRGVFGQAEGGSGIGVKGWASDDGDVENYGGYFSASGSRGIGVYGWAENIGDVENYGGKFLAEGKKGIGVYAEAPQRGIYSKATGEAGVGVLSEVSGEYADAVYGMAAGRAGVGVLGKAKGTSGQGVRGYADAIGNVTNYGGYFEARGDSGRGVYGKATGIEGRAVCGEASATWDVTNYGGYFSAAGQQGIGVYARATGTNGTGIFATGGSNGYAADFQGNVVLRSWSSGSVIMELGEGLDYAEGFDVSSQNGIAPGTVLIIDPDHPGKLTISDKPYDTRVAGIVAGARDQGSGVRLGAGQFDYDVALAGRVYCNVDATEASVEPGDLLTTSATPGYAMKVTDYDRAQGAILGKAMERLEQGERGQILVLVTLQ